MRVTGARVALAADRAEFRDLYIDQGRVSFIPRPSAWTLDLHGFLLLPGLINAHDHLEFNLFPKLGGNLYPNSRAWANDVHRPSESPVREHLELSKSARLLWGAVKCLLNGVTTVAHHNPLEDRLLDSRFPVHVIRSFGWAHSLDFASDLAERFQVTPSKWPFIVHAAEGIDAHARSEIERLDALGVLSDRTVLVHAIGLDPESLDTVRSRGCGIVWCPTSNLSVYGTTLGDPVLRSGAKIALGTDSAMTAQTGLLDEVRTAAQISSLAAGELYEMVTTRAAEMLRLHHGEGEIREGGVADFIAIEDTGARPADALQHAIPELVVLRGEIRLMRPQLTNRIRPSRGAPAHRIQQESRGGWLTDVDMPSLFRETAGALGPDFKLAGSRVSP